MKEEDLGPEYDSAGFTEDDRIVEGQYMVIVGNDESIIELFDYPESTQEINNYKEYQKDNSIELINKSVQQKELIILKTQDTDLKEIHSQEERWG